MARHGPEEHMRYRRIWDVFHVTRYFRLLRLTAKRANSIWATQIDVSYIRTSPGFARTDLNADQCLAAVVLGLQVD